METSSPATASAAGSVRVLLAEACWLRTSLAWERRDAAGTWLHLRTTLALNSESLYYRLNGARILAYDFPAWEITEDMPNALRRQISVRWANRALKMLEQGSPADAPAAYELLIERGVLRLRQLGDTDGAAALFREAALLPHAPDFAARVYAELLCRLGRETEALDWLRHIRPTLAESSASRRTVEERIKALEAKQRAK